MYQRPPLVSPFGPGGSTAGPSGYCHSPPVPNAGFELIGPVTCCGGFFVKSMAVQVVGPPPLGPPSLRARPPDGAPGALDPADCPKLQPCTLHGCGVSAEAIVEPNAPTQPTPHMTSTVVSLRTGSPCWQR